MDSSEHMHGICYCSDHLWTFIEKRLSEVSCVSALPLLWDIEALRASEVLSKPRCL